MSEAHRESPRGLYFEQFEVGHTWLTGKVTVTEEDVVRFARKWDPQPFHIDKSAAEAGAFGRLIASGLQTIVLTSRLFYDTGIFNGTVIAGRGFDETRFLKPLFPGDTIHVRATVMGRTVSSNGRRGRVIIKMETINQGDEIIYFTTLTVLVASRP